jgi:hypothetical protein
MPRIVAAFICSAIVESPPSALRTNSRARCCSVGFPFARSIAGHDEWELVFASTVGSLIDPRLWRARLKATLVGCTGGHRGAPSRPTTTTRPAG